MINQKFSTVAQGVKVQRSTQVKNGITLITEQNNTTVIVDEILTAAKAKEALNYFFNAAKNCTDLESLNAYHLNALAIAGIKLRNENEFREGVEL